MSLLSLTTVSRGFLVRHRGREGLDGVSDIFNSEALTLKSLLVSKRSY